MDKIKFDKRNYRIHDDRNKEMIRKSLNDFGAGRSILLDSENEIIAGNGVYEQAKELGMPVKIVETDGSELVVVKRTDLKTEDKKRKQLAIMDNSTSDSSKFDIPLLNTDFSTVELQELGIDIPNTANIDDFFTEEEKRPEKKPKMVKCPNCGEEFEYNG